MGERVIFLDRDGTLNEEVNYLHRPEDLVLLPGVREGLSRLKAAGFQLIVVTNQAGVARGYYPESQVAVLHEALNKELGPEAAVDAFYYCPHHPEHGIGKYKTACRCRKPEIGMLLDAERDIPGGIDKERSWMIGDKLQDTECGHRFGVPSILVGTGYGPGIREKQEADGMILPDGRPADGSYDYYAADFAAAAEYILESRRQ